ncbi:hypothetical protein DdX_12520 [Ditylenchus destructor]|uniref:Uncharacterized protein n=1 Tax=Ditylenchus destructor TaxID=166010 RepID=A0AAD4MY89_9BILA|nr:hypothetical protein DdX_12520 [Ditylenchus destructor]
MYPSDSDMSISDEDQPCSNLQNRLSDRHSELKAFRKEKAVLENVNRDLRLRLRMAELKAKQSTSQRDYRKQVEHCSNLETKLNECRSELAASRQENKETVDAKNILKVELEIEQEKTRQLKESSFWLKRELKDSKRKLELSENDLIEARQKKEEAQKKSTEWSEKACKLQTVLECETEVSKAHSFNEKENILKETTQKLAKTVFNLEKEQVRGSDMETQLTRQREEVEALRQKVTFYRQTSKTHKQDCSDHLSSLAKFQRETEQLRKHEMELRQQNAELRNQIGESESQIRQLKQKLTESEATIARLEADKKLETGRNTKRTDELQSMSNTKRMDEETIAYYTKENEHLRKDDENDLLEPYRKDHEAIKLRRKLASSRKMGVLSNMILEKCPEEITALLHQLNETQQLLDAERSHHKTQVAKIKELEENDARNAAKMREMEHKLTDADNNRRLMIQLLGQIEEFSRKELAQQKADTGLSHNFLNT